MYAIRSYYADIALLMAWIHVLIYENLYNKAFVDQYTFGLDHLKKHVKNMTPEWAYGITRITSYNVCYTKLLREFEDD